MSSKVKFVLNRAGVRELLRSEEVKNACLTYASNVQSRLGDGYEVTSFTGQNRANASVYAASFEAKKENSENNTLLKALGG